MIKKLCVIGVLGILMMGCEGGGAKEDYYPLAEGNTWEYAWESTTTVTGTFDTTYTQSGTTTTTVESAVTIGDKGDGWKVKSITDGTESYSYVYKGTDTLYVYKDENGDTLTYWEPLDLSTGTTWEIENTSGEIVYTTKYEVVGEEDVTVDAGEFKGAKKIKSTYSYEQDIPMVGKNITNYEGYFYRAKGVGMVMATYTTTVVQLDTTGTDTLSVTTVEGETKLTSYEVK